MRVRSHDDRDPGCRCCRYARENIEHLATCTFAGQAFRDLQRLAGLELRRDMERLRFAFCTHSEFPSTPRGGMGQPASPPVETHPQPPWYGWTQRAPPSCHVVAIRKEGSRQGRTNLGTVRRSTLRGEEVPDQSSKSRPMEPIASFTPEGHLVWSWYRV